MVASNEWEVQYLTETGWVLGGYEHDSGQSEKDTRPNGAVLRVEKSAILGKLGAPESAKVDIDRTELINDQQLVNELIEKYGQPKFGV